MENEKLIVEERIFEGKKILFVTNGVIELCVGKDFGPRIFRLNLVGKSNVFYNDAQSFVSAENKYRHYGGHRLWHTPEVAGVTDFPDNDPVSVTVEGDTVVISQLTGDIPLKRRISFKLSGNTVTLLHELTNEGPFAVETSCWAITQMKPNGYAVMPTSTLPTGLHSNRQFVVWPYTDMQDGRMTILNRYLTMQLDEKVNKTFKIGTNNDSGYGAFFTEDGQLFVKKFFYDDEGVYADHGASFEIYACGDFLEMETLSPLSVVEPGETLEHYEEWTLESDVTAPNPKDEAALFAFFKEKGLEIEW